MPLLRECMARLLVIAVVGQHWPDMSALVSRVQECERRVCGLRSRSKQSRRLDPEHRGILTGITLSRPVYHQTLVLILALDSAYTQRKFSLKSCPTHLFSVFVLRRNVRFETKDVGQQSREYLFVPGRLAVV